MSDLCERLTCVAAAWTPESHLHVGNLQWAAAGGDGSPPPSLTLTWGKPLAGFADVWIDGDRADVTVFLAPAASRHLVSQAVADLADLAA